ncbi:MAG: V-type ATP synthase subunit A [Nitrospinae bacterium]|nr:V-type ATP synthase subunit A [Nitrospinota bacterium]
MVSAVSGPAVRAGGMRGCFMHEMTRVGPENLLGEVIKIEGDSATLQVFESTDGLKIGDEVKKSGELLSVDLGPGLLGSVYDGIQRPLSSLYERWGNFIGRGAEIQKLDSDRKWRFTPTVGLGDEVKGGTVIGTVPETKFLTHKIMVPHGVAGKITRITEGDFTITEAVAELETGEKLTMMQRWNIREPRPAGGRLGFDVPMLTGQRVLDTLFPVAEGGRAIIPGGFGTGKTVMEQTIAKYASADVVVYVGCGERGNEMADLLNDFPKLADPHTGGPLMDRTVMIANTSNMPVSAREASIYTGITIAEYYRDMGLRVVLMADSTSRWAEALREMSSRLEEMPGEEGYPTYLPGRLAAFYERSGRFKCKGREDETGSITIVAAISPPGGDFSEPVTQASLRTVSTYWALDYDLAYQRHFPAVNWHLSFVLSYGKLSGWFEKNAAPDWIDMTKEVNSILQREGELSDMAKIVGVDSMGEPEKMELEAARLIREGYLRQSAVHPADSYCKLSRQAKLLSLILSYIRAATAVVREGKGVKTVLNPEITERILRAKELAEDKLDQEIVLLGGEINRLNEREPT